MWLCWYAIGLCAGFGLDVIRCCFGFVIRTVLIAKTLLCNCLTVLVQHQGLLCFSLCLWGGLGAGRGHG